MRLATYYHDSVFYMERKLTVHLNHHYRSETLLYFLGKNERSLIQFIR